MPRKISFLLLLGFLCLACTALLAQNKDPRARLAAAHALYYTPTASGLKSFHCDAAIDWKSMLTRLSGVDIPDDNPALKFLQTVHLSVDDELKGNGSLGWTSESEAPQDKAAAIKQIRDGLQTSVSGFFQTWNVYMNGSMVPIPDSTITVTNAGDGVHLSGTSDGSSFDEDFDKNMLLTEVRVVNPNMKVLATPTYASTPDGLLVSAVASQVSQPSTAPPAEAIFRIDYVKVESFQIPSRVVFDIKNTGVIEIAFNSCRVSLADLAKNPPSQ
ncbi:MAG: hypothetical protein WCA10_13415 [Terracidiphilus sp.]